MDPAETGEKSIQAVTRVLKGETVPFKYPGLLSEEFNFISGFLFRLLNELDLGYLTEALLIMLREIATNCAKANAKRLFFESQKKNIEDPEHFKELIPQFTGMVLINWEDFSKKHAESKYYILLKFCLRENGLYIQVENNAAIVAREWERINARFESYKKYQDLERALNEIGDDSEGAGLGIVLTLMFLHNAGIPIGNFKIHSAAGLTRTTMLIPRSLGPTNIKNEFKSIIQEEVNHLPSFPENITNLIVLCDSETSSLDRIAEEIQRDPALTAQILKLVNSAGYMNRFRNPSLTDAVKILGLHEIRNLLMVSGAREVITSKYAHRELEAIWEDSNRTSYFIRQLAGGRSGIQNHGVVAGLLYDLGHIVLLSLNPELLEKIKKLLISGRIRTGALIEEIELGISSPEIGALLAAKWNFPEPLTMAIRYQHKPLQAPEQYQELIHAVYTGISMQEAGKNYINYYSVEHDILLAFGIKNEEEFDTKVKNLHQQYKTVENSVR